MRIIEGNQNWPKHRAFVDLAIGTYYPLMRERLIKTVQEFGGQLHTWSSYPPGSKPQAESPYGFKIHAIKEAVKRGIKTIVWVDSSVWVIRDPTPFFEMVEDQGVIFFPGAEANKMARYVNDKSLQEFKITPEELAHLTLVAGTIFGLNMESEKGKKFFDEWARYEEGGWFREDDQPKEVRGPDGFLGHRHDEAVAALILLRQGIGLVPHYNIIQGDGSKTMFRSGKDGYV